MKSVKLVVPVILSAFFTFNAIAAQEVQVPTGQKIQTVSATSYFSLDDVVQQLSDKADKAGATSFKIISVNNGENAIRATAAIYK